MGRFGFLGKKWFQIVVLLLLVIAAVWVFFI